MLSFNPGDMEMPQIQGMLTGGIAPRPIAFVSTISKKGERNLSPFSFFNAFGSNPPMVAFSPSNRGRDNSKKDTYNNLMETGECVINAVTKGISGQVNLASSEYSSDVDEFVKSGLTGVDSVMVAPQGVLESPFRIECKLYKMIDLGTGPASGNLAICEIVMFHVSEIVMTNGRIDPTKIDHVGRNGGAYYTRSHGKSLFEIEKPGSRQGIGYDGLPEYMLKSHIYSANNLAAFALISKPPTDKEVLAYFSELEAYEISEYEFEYLLELKEWEKLLKAIAYYGKTKLGNPAIFERAARELIENNSTEAAWKVAVYKGVLFNE